jgi:hypothetical protein
MDRGNVLLGRGAFSGQIVRNGTFERSEIVKRNLCKCLCGNAEILCSGADLQSDRNRTTRTAFPTFPPSYFFLPRSYCSYDEYML